MAENLRLYEADDLDAVVRMWREVGWIQDDEHIKGLETLVTVGRAQVATLDGAAECFVHQIDGTINHLDVPLPMHAVTAVTTSHVGRKQGFASRLTRRALAHAYESGAAVAALGMFDQGFYDRFGFATSSYDHELSFDPATLAVDHVPYRTPVRITVDDAADMHHALVNRWMAHGSVCLGPPEITRADMSWTPSLTGLGYRNESGALTHGFFGAMKDREHGPLRVVALAYQNTQQLLEVLRLLRELGDQVRSVKMFEPPHAQLQRFVREPFRQQDRSSGSSHASGHRAVAWMQFRMLDVAACVEAYSWCGDDVAFNLTLTDPLAAEDSPWSGVGGEYRITIGEKSSVAPAHEPRLPTVTADVAAFTRLWFGVATASSLLATDRFDAPPELVAQLDAALRLPPVRTGWDF